MKKPILVRLPEQIYTALKEIAQQEKWSLNQTGEEAVIFYLKARKKIFKE